MGKNNTEASEGNTVLAMIEEFQEPDQSDEIDDDSEVRQPLVKSNPTFDEDE